jgi:hypothetical protein
MPPLKGLKGADHGTSFASFAPDASYQRYDSSYTYRFIAEIRMHNHAHGKGHQVQINLKIILYVPYIKNIQKS